MNTTALPMSIDGRFFALKPTKDKIRIIKEMQSGTVLVLKSDRLAYSNRSVRIMPLTVVSVTPKANRRIRPTTADR
jgi:hypothetical protein